MKAEFKNPSSTSNSQVAAIWKTDMLTLYFLYLFIIFFLFKWDLPWNHFVMQNIITNIVLPIQPPKTSDWHFTWQNGYGCHPLINKSQRFNFLFLSISFFWFVWQNKICMIRIKSKTIYITGEISFKWLFLTVLSKAIFRTQSKSGNAFLKINSNF